MSPKYDPVPEHHWAILDILPATTENGVTIIIWTNKASHLTEYWLLVAPKGLRWYRIIRGIVMYCLKKWRFNKPYTLEQVEPGDTLEHTFVNVPWPYCQKRWFCFAGTVAGVPTLPTGPIFKYHRSQPIFGPLVTARFYPTPGGTGVAADGQARRTMDGATWANIHDGPGNTATDTSGAIWVTILAYNILNNWWMITRGFIHFDTLSLPLGSHIISAKVAVYCFQKNNSPGWSPSLALVRSLDPTPGSIQPVDYQNIANIRIAPEIAFPNVIMGDWNFFQIYSDYFPYITPTGVTKLGLRISEYDTLNFPPPWQSVGYSAFGLYSLDAGLPTTPYLEITYQPLL